MKWLSEPWPWWVAGSAIGLIVTAFAFATGKPVGVSTGIGGLCARIAPGIRYFQQSAYKAPWRIWFIAGIPLGGLLGAALAGKVGWVTSMGDFDSGISGHPVVRLAFLFVGGTLAGYGARWAGG